MRTTLTTATAILVVASAGFAQEASKDAASKTATVVPPAASAADAKAAAIPADSLVAPDVRDWRGLAKRLEVMGEAELPPVSAIWKSMSAEAKAATKRIAKATTAEAADQRIVLEALNGWIAGRTSAVDAAVKPDNVRDAEILSLLKLTKPEPAETRRLHRLLVDSMFPFELKQQTPMLVADRSEKSTSAYPPKTPAEVTLRLSVPRLKGRLNVFFGSEALVFSGDKPLEMKVPNTGSVRYRLTGDGYDAPFGRTIRWTDDDVKNGVVERTLSMSVGRNGE